MSSRLGPLGDALSRTFSRLANFFASATAVPELVINRVQPWSGWPGTIVTLDGAGFADSFDDNKVEIGGDAALVMRASAGQLTVLVGDARGPGRSA